MNVFPIITANGAHVRRVRKLLLVIVLVKPRGPPLCITLFDELHPRLALNVLQRLCPAQFQQTGRHIHGERLLRDHLRLAQTRITNQQRNTQTRLVRRALVYHAVFAFQEPVVSHEHNDRVVQLLALLQLLEQTSHAVVHTQDGAPIAVHHVFKVLHRFRPIIRELLAPFKQRPVNSMPSVQALRHPRGFVL